MVLALRLFSFAERYAVAILAAGLMTGCADNRSSATVTDEPKPQNSTSVASAATSQAKTPSEPMPKRTAERPHAGNPVPEYIQRMREKEMREKKYFNHTEKLAELQKRLKEARHSNHFVHNLQLAREASAFGDKSLVPLLLEAAEAWAGADRMTHSVILSALHAADILDDIHPQLFAYVKDYKKRPLLAEAAILILAREADPQIVQNIEESINIKELQALPEGSPILSAFRAAQAVLALDKHFMVTKTAEDKLRMVFAVFSVDYWDDGNPTNYSVAGPYPEQYWAPRRLRDISEQYPKETAQGILGLPKYVNGYCEKEGEYALRRHVANLYLCEPARQEFYKLLAIQERKDAEKKAAQKDEEKIKQKEMKIKKESEKKKKLEA